MRLRRSSRASRHGSLCTAGCKQKAHQAIAASRITRSLYSIRQVPESVLHAHAAPLLLGGVDGGVGIMFNHPFAYPPML